MYISQFRPIAMANFKYKIISKILADKLAQILPDNISKEQIGFMKGAINMAKAFDTIDRSFLLKVLKAFGFNNLLYNWIHVILHSDKLSISINEKK